MPSDRSEQLAWFVSVLMLDQEYLTMTLPYEWNPMPHTLDVKCPSCGEKAFFEFAEVVRIREKKDVGFFQSNNQFNYELCRDSCGHRWHAAFFFAGLHGSSTKSIRDLPEGYAPSDWEHSKYLYRSHQSDRGAVTCSGCHYRKCHELQWPRDAFYQIEYKQNTLWAFHHESASELLDFISSTNRDRSKYRWHGFLMKVPTLFLRQNARGLIVKKLGKLVAKSQQGSNKTTWIAE